MISGSCLAVRGLTAEGKIYFFCLEVRFVLGVGGGVGGGSQRMEAGANAGGVLDQSVLFLRDTWAGKTSRCVIPLE